MYAVSIPYLNVFPFWRQTARRALSHGIAPEDILWQEAGADHPALFSYAALPDNSGTHRVHVPPAFIQLAEKVIWHRSPERFLLLYTALWRFYRRQGNPLSPADPLGTRLNRMAQSVGRDIHKMHAFVRFRELLHTPERRWFVAWFEPEHHTLEPGSRFFVERFGDMDWSILTPRICAHFCSNSLHFTAGCAHPNLPSDASEALWETYFSTVFNPARVKLNAMRAEMPQKYWKNLPETRLIPAMLAGAEDRVKRMIAAGASTPRKGSATISTRYREYLKQGN